MDTPDPTCIEEQFAANIRRERERLGLSQDNFALKAGIARSYYNRIEGGHVDVSISTIAKIATAMKVSPEVLLKNTKGLVGRKAAEPK